MRRAAMSMVSIQARTKGRGWVRGSGLVGEFGEFDSQQRGGVFQAGAAVGGGGEFYVDTVPAGVLGEAAS